MNEESLRRVNAFLAAVADRIGVGEVLEETPAEIGRALGMPDALATARAVRALIARRRLEAANGSYRLLDPSPVGEAERESIARPRRKKKKVATRRDAGGASSRRGGGAAYSDLGRAAADKLVELGRENAELRVELRQAREDLRSARASQDDAERRARGASERVSQLEGRAEMAETNLRSLLATARGRDVRGDGPVGDPDMAAILGVLKGDEEVDEEIETPLILGGSPRPDGA